MITRDGRDAAVLIAAADLDELEETVRILCRVRETPREVIVLRIEHRRDVYRPR